MALEEKTGGGIDWPPYSADITVCDYFLWGYMRDQVFKVPSQDLEVLRDRIIESIRGIPEDIRHRAVEAFQIRLRHMIVMGGSHFEQILH